MRAAVAASALLLLAGCASTARDAAPAAAAPSPQPQEVAALEARVNDLQTSMTELLERIDVLNARMASIEQSVSRAPEAPAAAAAASPSRMMQAVARPAAPAAAAPATVSRSLASADLADEYRNALMLYGQGKFEDARHAFQKVFDADHAGDLADNSLYWIGETYFAGGNFPEALKYYRRVTTEYGDANKAPDALFKTAVTYERIGDLGVAKSTLEELIRRYPYSSPAASAKLELKRIRY